MTTRARLETELARYTDLVVAFSGGVDSTLLLRVALDVLGDRCSAVTAVSPTMAAREVRDAAALAAELGLGQRYYAINSHELDDAEFRANPTTRCAMCKTELMSIAAPLAARLGARVALGTVTDDLGDFRPGIAAARSEGAVMPLVDAGFSKADVRKLAHELNLRVWDKPQLACLSSRFPYGTEITPARLRQVDDFEAALHQLGCTQVRVRYHDTVARIEVEPSDIARLADATLRQQIVAAGRAHGFTYVTLDLAGFRSGSANEVLTSIGRGRTST